MARVKRSVHGRKHHRAVLEQAKGYYGNKSRSYRAAALIRWIQSFRKSPFRARRSRYAYCIEWSSCSLAAR